MSDRYVIFFFFPLEPPFFYLFVNFIDLMFNHFIMNPVEEDHKFRKLEILILLVVNIFNLLLLGIGILTFFIFLLFQTYQTVFHKIYVYIRFIITIFRMLSYVLTVFFYIYLMKYNLLMDSDFTTKIIMILLLVFFEVNDIYWSVLLKRLVFGDSVSKSRIFSSFITVESVTEELTEDNDGEETDEDYDSDDDYDDDDDDDANYKGKKGESDMNLRDSEQEDIEILTESINFTESEIQN